MKVQNLGGTMWLLVKRSSVELGIAAVLAVGATALVGVVVGADGRFVPKFWEREFIMKDGTHFFAESELQAAEFKRQHAKEIKNPVLWSTDPKLLRFVVLMILLTFFPCLAVVVYRADRRVFGLLRGRFSHVVIGVASGCAMAMLGEAYDAVLHWTSHARTEIEPILARLGAPIAVLLLVCVVAPVVEELYFRGRLYGLTSLAEPKVRLWATSLLFAASHCSLIGFPIYLMLGLWLGELRRRQSNLLGPVVAHATNNAMSLVLVRFWSHSP